jgi:hypothetical protein
VKYFLLIWAIVLFFVVFFITGRDFVVPVFCIFSWGLGFELKAALTKETHTLRITRYLAAMMRAIHTFRNYETLHRAKGNIQNAEANAHEAEALENAINGP